MHETGAGTFEPIKDDSADSPNTYTSMSLKVNNVEGIFARLRNEVELYFPLRLNSWGDSSFAFLDPDGFVVCLFTETPKGGASAWPRE